MLFQPEGPRAPALPASHLRSPPQPLAARPAPPASAVPPVDLLSPQQLERLLARLQAQLLAACDNDRQRLTAYNRLLVDASSGLIDRAQLHQRVCRGERESGL